MNFLDLSDYDFELFRNLIYKQCGINFTQVNKSVLETRIMAALKKHNISDLLEFYNLLISEDKELIDFIDDITTNLTKFFRIEKHFEVLKKEILPQIALRKKKNKLNDISIWSAGCSTGEEPYSVAMTCLETPELNGFNINILASDISLKCLVKAKEGVYDKDKVLTIPKDYLEKYFYETEEKYIVKKNLKDIITFDYHNLMHLGIQKNIDVILCRNVLIYFDEAGRKVVEQRFYDTLNEHGCLLLGHSESLLYINTIFVYKKIQDISVYIKQ